VEELVRYLVLDGEGRLFRTIVVVARASAQ
jgi:hypothetical protein